MNYGKIYQDLCEKGKTERKHLYTERHHIIPVFFFKQNKRKLRYGDGIFEGTGETKDNITRLTPREHFIAHRLLCKVFANTKWYYRCASSLMLFFNKDSSKHKRVKMSAFAPGSSRAYDRVAQEARNAISNARKNTMPVKCSKTGEMVGSVNTNHPKVISGEWVHHTKGTSFSDERKQVHREISTGYTNGNSKFSDDDLLDSYVKACIFYGVFVGNAAWCDYAEKFDLPHMKSWKKFRFDGEGRLGMEKRGKEMIEERFSSLGVKEVERNSHEYRKTITEGKLKWD